MHPLDRLFRFQSVAIVGASDSSEYGAGPYRALRDLGFEGRCFPVNPRREQVHGLKAYPDPQSLPEPIDAAAVVVGREYVVPSVEACADGGARAIVVVSAGFAEADDHGRQLQSQLSNLARSRDLTLVGPNCFGVASVMHRASLFVGSGLKEARVGNVGVISHSGGLLNEIISYGNARGIGFSHLASTGNEAGATAADLIEYLVQDPTTEVILAILESVRDPRLFVEAAEAAVEARKPLVVLKLGASAKAAASALTHTAALSGSDAVFDALFRQKGITRVHDLDELIEMGVLLSGAIPVLRARSLERAAVIEISGGGKGLVCDAAAASGVDLPDLSETGVSALQPHLPTHVEASNPLDTGGSWGTPDMEQLYPLALRTLAAEETIDMVVSRFTVPRDGALGPLRQRLDEMETVRGEHPDRLFAVLSRTRDRFSDDWARVLREEGVVFLQGYGQGMIALGRLAAYSRYLRRREGQAAGRTDSRTVNPATVKLPRAGGLNEVESKDLLRAAGLRVVPTGWARSADEAVALAEGFGYPVAAKVLSPQVLHKSDVGGVRLGLGESGAVRDAFADLQRITETMSSAEFQGVAVQPMAAPGLELVLGANRDPLFGPTVMFGLGGVLVEVLHDVSLRVAPVSRLDASEMLEEVRGKALLDGVRGTLGVSRQAIVDAICLLSELMLQNPSIESVDLNPVFAYPDSLLAVDARVIVG